MGGGGWRVTGCMQTLHLNTQRDLRSVSPSVRNKNVNPVRMMDEREVEPALRNTIQYNSIIFIYPRTIRHI